MGHAWPLIFFSAHWLRIRSNAVWASFCPVRGMDGTLGSKAIKAQGGFVIAQDPITAEYEGMLCNRHLNSGTVDHILSPEAIPDVSRPSAPSIRIYGMRRRLCRPTGRN